MRRDDKRSQRARRCCESDTADWFAASKREKRLDGAYDFPRLQGPIAEELPGSVAMAEDQKSDTRQANMAARRRLSRGGDARAVSDANCALSIFPRDI